MKQVQKRLNGLISDLERENGMALGYPCTKDFDYSPLYPLFQFAINNCGDPFSDGGYRVNTKEFEREVIQFFQKLMKANEKDTWGYVTNGGTEGNLYGLFLAREKYPDGIVYYSKDTHYSVVKIIKLLRVKAIVVDSLPNGEIDYDVLSKSVSLHSDKPAIIFANLGTTMKGAVDDISRIKKIVEDVSHYIHADGALGGMILPFVDNPSAYSFEDGIDSISISGHKFIGSPVPCGIVLANKENVHNIGRSVEYIHSIDNTISGSRNGISPMFLWYAIEQVGEEGFRKRVQGCFKVSDYAIEEFSKIGINAWRNPNSITVVFQRGAKEVMTKYHIAMEGDIGHILVMPDVSRDHIDRLIEDLKTADKGGRIEPRK